MEEFIIKIIKHVDAFITALSEISSEFKIVIVLSKTC